MPAATGRRTSVTQDVPDHQDQGYAKYAARWQEEMSAIKAKVVPGDHPPPWDFADYQLDVTWSDFLSACVL